MTWTYRPALDGTRTIAVYLVVLFHAGVSWFGGGFIGVDLFFVLSGFLVSSILLAELDETGRLRVVRFFSRRVRRLLPAAVVAVTATAAVFVLLTPSIRRLPLIGDAQASLLYAANWRFLYQENDYFGAEVDRSPYLHFWSLSIEEQFYVGFPLLLIALVVASRRWRGSVVPVGIGVLCVGSVVAQLAWAQVDANHAYYGTDARAYQLLAGVLAGLVFRSASRQPGSVQRAAAPMAVGGVVLVVALGSGLLDLTPSNRGLLVTVGRLR